MNVLIVGLGSIAQKHIRALREISSDVHFFALRSHADAPSEDGIENIYRLDELHVDLDFAIVSNPTHVHIHTIRNLLPLGVPLFIEKPLALDMHGVRDLVREVADAGIVTYVGCPLRHHPCLQFVRTYLHEHPRTIRSIAAYCGSYMPDWQPGKDWRTSFRADSTLSGGVHLELIHEMDYIVWIFGKPVSTTKTLHASGTFNETLIDTAHYDVSYENFSGTIDLNYTDRKAQRWLHIFFEDGELILDFLAGTVTVDGMKQFATDCTMHDVLVAQMRHFLDCLATGKDSIHPCSQAADVLHIALQ